MRISDWSSDVCSSDLRRIFHHLVGGLDHLGIDLIGALGLDHVDEFLDDIDVRSFEHAAAQAAAALFARGADLRRAGGGGLRSEEHTSELQSLIRTSYAVLCLTNKKTT